VTAAFTPGPWVVDATPNANIAGAHWREIRAGNHGQVLAEVYHDLGDPDPGLTDAAAEANARLIAAAPELYEKAEALLNDAHARADLFNARCRDLRAALAKAVTA
jgi:hypothetical protein